MLNEISANELLNKLNFNLPYEREEKKCLSFVSEESGVEVVYSMLVYYDEKGFVEDIYVSANQKNGLNVVGYKLLNNIYKVLNNFSYEQLYKLVKSHGNFKTILEFWDSYIDTKNFITSLKEKMNETDDLSKKDRIKFILNNIKADEIDELKRLSDIL